MANLKGRTALITGGARGQGRSHALTLAKAGADIILFDSCDSQTEGLPYRGASKEELAETKALVEGEGQRCIAIQGDVRSRADLDDALAQGLAEFEHVDILCSNAGISRKFAKVADIPLTQWQEVVDINLTGMFNAMSTVLPHMAERGYGRIVATASMAGRAGYGNIADYTAAKWGIVGLVKTAANDYARSGITVNCVCPTTVNTAMATDHLQADEFICPDIPNPSREQVYERMSMMHPIGVPFIEPVDVSNAVLFLVSEEARYLSGEVLTVSAASSAMNLG